MPAKTAAKDAIPQTIRLSPGVTAAARSLPLGEPTLDPASDAAVAPTVAQLLTAAAQPGKAGLVALLQLMHAAGIVVTDADQSGAVVQAAAAPEMGNIDAGEITALQTLIAAGDTTSLQGVLNSIAALSRSRPVKVNDLLPAMRASLAAEAGSPTVTERAWAQIIYDGGAAGQALAQPSGGAPQGDLLLPPVQVILLLTQLIGEAAATVRPAVNTSVHQGASEAVPAVLVAYRTGSENSQDCTPTTKSGQILSGILKSQYGKIAKPVLNKILDAIEEKLGAAARGAAQAALTFAEVASPVLQFIVLKAFFHVKITASSEPLIRNKDTGLNPVVNVTAHFYFTAPPGRMWNCLALAAFGLTGGKANVQFKKEEPITDMPFRWHLSDSNTETPRSYKSPIVEFHSKTGNTEWTDPQGDGHAEIWAVPQSRDLTSKPVFQVSEHATVSVQAEPNGATFDKMLKSMSKLFIGGAKSVLKAASVVGALTSYGTYLLTELGAFSGWKIIPVSDWAELPTSIDLNATGTGVTFHMHLVAVCAGTVQLRGVTVPACQYTMAGISGRSSVFSIPPWQPSFFGADVSGTLGTSGDSAEMLFTWSFAGQAREPSGGAIAVAGAASGVLLLKNAGGTNLGTQGSLYGPLGPNLQQINVPITATFNYS